MKATTILAFIPLLSTYAAAQGIFFYYNSDCTGEEDTEFGAPARAVGTCEGDLYSPLGLKTEDGYPGYTVKVYSDSFCTDLVGTYSIADVGCQTIATGGRAYEIYDS